MTDRVTSGLAIPVFSLILLASLVSCFSAGTFVSPESSDGTPAQLSAVELERLTRAVGTRVEALGLVPHPRLEWVREIHDDSRESEFRVVTAFVIGPDAPTKDRIEVSVLRSKKNNSVSVLVRNRDWPFSTDFMDSVVRSVEAALAEALPDRKVLVRRKTDSPMLP